MKKTLILTVATGLACAMSSMAAQYNLYITGATAFRQSVHNAALDLFDTPPATNVVQSSGTLQYGTKTYGGDATLTSGNTQWYMRGTASNAVPNLGTNELVIHALFNGSVQGIKNVINKDKLYFMKGDGAIITNTPTIAFTDVPSSSTPYPTSATADFDEDKVAVQPFAWTRAMAGNSLMTNVNNISYEQAKYLITAGRAKVSAWTMSPNTNLVYLIGRTKDSGTRRLMLACSGYTYNTGLIMYNYDATNHFYYPALDNGIAAAVGSASANNGLVGSAGVDGVNLAWGPGYIGGGDCRTAVNIVNSNNFSIAYMSFADAKTAGITGSNWSAVIPFNGFYPTIGTNGSFFKADGTPWIWGASGTNNFSPITSGLYSGWAYEVMVYPITDPSAISADQDLTTAILGDANTQDTILGIFNKKYTAVQTPGKGSIEKQIESTKVAGATAIRIADMKTSRAAVGAVITP